ncbi:MAG: YkvA family protein [bacterium]
MRGVFRGSGMMPGLGIRFLLQLPKLAKLYIRLFKDPRVPLYLKAMVIAALIYVLSPLDLIPDFLMPIFGYIDDLFILLITLRYFLIKCPQDVLWEHVRAIEGKAY